MPRPRPPRPHRWRLYAHLGVAAATVLASVPALLWWRNSVAFVIVISLVTQVYAALSAAEGSDESAVTDRLDRIEQLLKEHR